MKQIRLAVIGTGLIGRTHLALIHENPHCRLIAVCDANPGALAVAEEYGVRFYQDYTRLLAEQKLDGVIIATPTALHAEVGIACAERGLHLLIEKPVAATLEDANEHQSFLC